LRRVEIGRSRRREQIILRQNHLPLSMSQTLSETTSETRSPGPLPALIGAPLERIVGSQCFHVGERQVLNHDSFDEVSAMATGYRQSTPTLYPV
jgi:hypothetical protein